MHAAVTYARTYQPMCMYYKYTYICLFVNLIFLNRYISYCVSLIKMLQYHKISPVLVFDGGRLPSKANTEHDRRQYVYIKIKK